MAYETLLNRVEGSVHCGWIKRTERGTMETRQEDRLCTGPDTTLVMKGTLHFLTGRTFDAIKIFNFGSQSSTIKVELTNDRHIGSN
jgi:hypothetical protein